MRTQQKPKPKFHLWDVIDFKAAGKITNVRWNEAIRQWVYEVELVHAIAHSGYACITEEYVTNEIPEEGAEHENH